MITLADVVLMLPDLDGELQAWIDRWLPLEAMRDLSHPVSLMNSRPQSVSGNTPGVGLAIPNYPEPPECKLNTLYWPTGATRWARGYFLCHQEDLAEILAAAGDENNPLTLTLRDEENDYTLSTEMYLLPPRPLSAIWPSTAGIAAQVDGVYLLPLVDARYNWQNVSTAELSGESIASWDNVFLELGTRLGVTITTDTISSSYYIPDPQELERKYENAAVLLDAAAHSVGMRVVRQLDGTVEVVGPTSSSTTYSDNITSGSLLMGGSLDDRNEAAVRPASVTVTFQKYRECAVDPNGDPHVETISTVLDSTPGTSKVIHSSAFADYSTKGGTPDNSSQVSALANQIASDFYHWLDHNHDMSLPSLQEWILTGFEDYVEWHFGNVSHQQYQAYMRVHGRPYNFGDEEQLQQFPDMPVYPPLVRFKLTETLLPGDSAADAVFVDGSDGETATTDVLHVYDTTGRGFGLATEIGWAEYKGDSLQWEFVCMEGCLTRHGKAVSSTGAGAAGSFTVYYSNSGVETSAGFAVVARNIGGSLSAGDDVILWYEPRSATWYAMSPGSADPTVVVVKVGDYSAAEDTCLYPGTVQGIEGTFTGACADPFTTGAACLLLVLNYEGGSFSPSHMRLVIGEYYIGKVVGSIDSVPVIAIRIASQIFHTTCPSPGVNAGEYIDVPLGFATPTVRNWTDTRIDPEVRVTVYWDRYDANWYMIASTGTSVTRIWHASANEDIAPGEFGLVELSTGAIVSAFNWSAAVQIRLNDYIHVYQDPADDVYYIIAVPDGDADIDASYGKNIINPTDTGVITRSDSTEVDAENRGDLSVYHDNSIVSFNLDTDRVFLPLGTHVHHMTCPSPGCDAGSSMLIELPDGQTKTVTNWSSSRILSDQKIFVVWDPANSSWYMWPSAVPQVWNLFITILSVELKSEDEDGTVEPTEPGWRYTNAAYVPSAPYTASNPYKLCGNAGDKVVVAELPDIDDGAPSNEKTKIVAVQSPHRVWYAQADETISPHDFGNVILSDGREVDGLNWGSSTVTAGEYVAVFQDPTNLAYYILKSGGNPGELVRFQLTSYLTGNTALAKIVEYDGATWVASGPDITVIDFTIYGWFSDASIATGQPQLYGWATEMPDHPGYYEIVNMERFNPFVIGHSEDVSAEIQVQPTGVFGPGRMPSPDVGFGDPYVASLVDTPTLLPGRQQDDEIFAVWSTELGTYNAIYGQSTAGFVEFHLFDALAGEADAGEAELYGEQPYWGTQADYLDPTRRGESFYIRNDGLYQHVVADAKGIGSLDALYYASTTAGPREHYYRAVVVDQRSFLVRATVVSDFNAADGVATVNSTAAMLYFPFSLDVPGDELEPSGTLVAVNAMGKAGRAGDPCVLCWDSTEDKYIILEVKRATSSGTTWFRGTISSNFIEGDPTASVTSLQSLNASVTAPVGTITANNYLKWRGDAGDICYVLENDSAGGTPTYELMSVEWDVVSRVEDVDYSTSFGLRQTKRSFISKDHPADAPVVVVPLRTSDLVTDVIWDGTDLTYYHRNIYYLGDPHGINTPQAIYRPVDQSVVYSVSASGGVLTALRKSVKVWGIAESSSVSVTLFTTTYLNVVTDVYVSGLDLRKDVYQIGVLVVTGGADGILIVDGTECPPP